MSGPVVTFPTKGPQSTWELTAEKHAELVILFPGLDLDLEFSTMLAWIEKNGPKTARGMNLFVLNWLRRAKKAPTDTYSWNHDALPPPKQPEKPLDAGDLRRIELWRQCEAEGMDYMTAKNVSYQRFKAEREGR